MSNDLLSKYGGQLTFAANDRSPHVYIIPFICHNGNRGNILSIIRFLFRRDSAKAVHGNLFNPLYRQHMRQLVIVMPKQIQNIRNILKYHKFTSLNIDYIIELNNIQTEA